MGASTPSVCVDMLLDGSEGGAVHRSSHDKRWSEYHRGHGDDQYTQSLFHFLPPEILRRFHEVHFVPKTEIQDNLTEECHMQQPYLDLNSKKNEYF